MSILQRYSLFLRLWHLSWLISSGAAFSIPPTTRTTTRTCPTITPQAFTASPTHLFSSTSPSPPSSPSSEFVTTDKAPSDQWELDCYSRPVLVNGKKLWEVLITDSTGSFRYIQSLPSNQVNSRELRKVVESVMEQAEVKPSIIRFFRGAMFNMINIALSELDVVGRPSRCTNTLAQWLEERHANVYPNMEGYKATMATSSSSSSPSFLDVRTPVRLPDALRGEQYAFVSLPLAEFLPGGSIDASNIGVGRLCPIPSLNDNNTPPAAAAAGDAFVQGVVILSSRAPALAQWLAGTEVAALSADLRKRTLVMETDIDTQYLMAKLNDEQRQEAAAFEQGKDDLMGLHFVSVQRDENDDPAGFWLLREIPTGI